MGERPRDRVVLPDGFEPDDAELPEGFIADTAGPTPYTGMANRRPFSAEEFMTPEQIRNADSSRGWPATLWEIAKGAAKGAGSTVAGIGEMAVNAGMVPGQTPSAFNPAFRSPVFQVTDELTRGENMPQRVGKLGEFAAEVAMPAAELTKVAQGVPTALRAIRQPAARAARQVAEHGFIGAARKSLIGALSDSLERAGAEVAPQAENASARLIKEPVRKSLEQDMTDALAEVADMPPDVARRTTLPPAPDLPPGYEPRTSVPKPKMVKTAADAASKQFKPSRADTSVDRGGYFLRKPAPAAEAVPDVAGEPAPVSPGSVTEDMLPSSLRGFTADKMIRQLMNRRDIPKAVRLQMIDALKRQQR